MRLSIFSLLSFLTIQGHAQVLDVNGDGLVAAEEAIAVAEQWKGPASAANAHNHLGQTWIGNRNPLKLSGDFPPQIVIGPLKGEISPAEDTSAPLILENTSPSGADLQLRGNLTIQSLGNSQSDLGLRTNNGIDCYLNADGIANNFASFIVYDRDRSSAVILTESGNVNLNRNVNAQGSIFAAGGYSKIDHPLDPANKYLTHSSVDSPEMKNVYDGVVVLDENGEAVVQLPDYVESFNCDFRYQLTCIGGFAPVFIAEEIQDNRFKISGGRPGMKVSWLVTGVRQDLYAKANPIEVEQVKSREEKGKFLHPELYGEPAEKSVGLVQELVGE